jgi:hypothetical protein
VPLFRPLFSRPVCALPPQNRWLPPCTTCYADAQRYCVDCNLTFCNDHYEDYHEAEDMKNHEWRGADTDKVRTVDTCSLGRRQLLPHYSVDLVFSARTRSITSKAGVAPQC